MGGEEKEREEDVRRGFFFLNISIRHVGRQQKSQSCLGGASYRLMSSRWIDERSVLAFLMVDDLALLPAIAGMSGRPFD